MKRVLFFSYYFPPMGGAGIQRSLSFIKYLPEFQYQPVVVAGSVPVLSSPDVNQSLMNDINGIKIVRMPVNKFAMVKRKFYSFKLIKIIPHSEASFEWWLKSALETCEKLLKTEKFDLIYTTACPFSAAKLGKLLASRFHIPWILDLRDPWAIDDIKDFPTYFHYLIDKHAMKKACEKAAAVIMNTPSARKAFLANFPKIAKNKIYCITNGYDENLLSKAAKPANQIDTNQAKTLKFLYSGQFFTEKSIFVDADSRKKIGFNNNMLKYWLKDLLLYRPGAPDLLCRSPYYFFIALSQLLKQSLISPQDINISLVGNMSEMDKNLCSKLGLEELVSFTGYISYKESIDHMNNCNVLLLTQHKPRKLASPLSIPGKLYDLMRFGKPILGLVPQGDAYEILDKSGLGFICEPDNIDEIKKTILNMLHIFKQKGSIPVDPDLSYISKFDRVHLTQQLSNVFDKAICK